METGSNHRKHNNLSLVWNYFSGNRSLIRLFGISFSLAGDQKGSDWKDLATTS